MGFCWSSQMQSVAQTGLHAPSKRQSVALVKDLASDTLMGCVSSQSCTNRAGKTFRQIQPRRPAPLRQTGGSCLRSQTQAAALPRRACMPSSMIMSRQATVFPPSSSLHSFQMRITYMVALCFSSPTTAWIATFILSGSAHCYVPTSCG